MLEIVKQQTMGKSDRDWLHSTFHFSFAEYYDPQNMQFGTLRVVNDDTFDPRGGFDSHFHENMEIISYVVSGTLTHRDNMGNVRTVERGGLQYMSAGTGVLHSEFNHNDQPLRFLQIWILPDRQDVTPQYGDYVFSAEQRQNRWHLLAASFQEQAPVQLHQDMRISVAELDVGRTLVYPLAAEPQAYLIQIEGDSNLDGYSLTEKDAAKIIGQSFTLTARNPAHYILFDMPRPL